MAIRRESVPSSETAKRRRNPATTPESRESKMISLAEKVAERQLLDGTVSAQVLTHYLKLGSTREQLEQKRLEGEVELQKARIEAMASTQRLEELYTAAMESLRGYRGELPAPDEDDDFD